MQKVTFQRPFGVELPVFLFILGMILPPEASLNLGNLRFSGYRFVLLLYFFPCIYLLFTGARGRIIWADFLIVLHAVWALMALIRQAGPGQGLESGGIYVIESVGAYLIGRVHIRTYADFQRFAKLFVGITLLLLLFTLPESLVGRHFIRDLASAAFGGPGAHDVEQRLGLTRAFGPFDHPILYGVFSASAFSIAYYTLGASRLWPIRFSFPAISAALATFLSLSGGPFVALGAQVVVIAWERITQGVRYRWTGIALVFVGIWSCISLLSNRSPFLVFISYLTFSSESAYNRVLIWQYGTAEVGRHPMFGIGLGDWVRAPWMNESMDNFWLVTAVRYGLPAFIFLAAAICILIKDVASRKLDSKQIRRARHAWGFTLLGLAIAGCTVHFWNALFVLFFLILGSGAWIRGLPVEARNGVRLDPHLVRSAYRRDSRPHSPRVPNTFL